MSETITLKSYARLEYDGAIAIIEWREVESIIDNSSYHISKIWLSDNEFNNLHEFEGF